MKLLNVLAVCVTVFCFGCASNQVSLKQMNETEIRTSAIFFFSVRIENEVKRRYQPEPLTLRIESIGESIRTIHYRFSTHSFQMKGKSFHEYLVPVVLSPGSYRFVSITGVAGPAVEQSHFTLPLNASVELRRGEKAYGGFLVARVIEKKFGEKPAGRVQANVAYDESGLSAGKFEIRVLDRKAEDQRLLRQEYPFLEDVEFIDDFLIPKSAAKPIPKGGKKRGKNAEPERDSDLKQLPVVVAPAVVTSEVGRRESRPLPSAQPQQNLPDVREHSKGKTSKCSVHQILEMKALGLSEPQIEAACE